MIIYREADPGDWESIAKLHARNWQLNYRESMSHDYLDNHLVDERRGVWKKRFEKVNENQLTILAELDGQLVAFACIFLESDLNHGALLDNLHVAPELKRQGIGKILMKKSAALVLQNGKNSSMYLWVITNNENAINFYESLGGIRHDTKAWKTPDNRNIDTYRYVWNDLEKLANLM